MNVSWYDYYKSQLINNPNAVITLNPNKVVDMNGANIWNSSLTTKNMFGETPCLALAYDTKTKNMYGIMYLSTTTQKSVANKGKLVLKTALSMSNLGVINYTKSDGSTKLLSSSTWIPGNSKISFNTLTSGCVGTLADNSPIINMDMLTSFNQRLVPIVSVLKTSDQKYNGLNTYSRYLPGHLLNNNTLKANVNLAQGSKVVLDNTGQVYINVNSDTSQTTNVNLGSGATNDQTTALVADTLQPNQIIQSGTECQASEVGKTAVDAGNSYVSTTDQVNTYLSKNQ